MQRGRRRRRVRQPRRCAHAHASASRYRIGASRHRRSRERRSRHERRNTATIASRWHAGPNARVGIAVAARAARRRASTYRRGTIRCRPRRSMTARSRLSRQSPRSARTRACPIGVGSDASGRVRTISSNREERLHPWRPFLGSFLVGGTSRPTIPHGAPILQAASLQRKCNRMSPIGQTPIR